MNSNFRSLGRSELLPRYIFAESLFARRRVLEVGAVASTAGESARFLVERGARQVVACDADLAAVEEAQRKHGQEALRFRADVLEDLEAFGFDLVLVADLAPYVSAPARLAELARRVARGGFLMGGLRNPAGLAFSQLMEPEGRDPLPTFGQLLDALSPHFRSVEVATQSPVLGYQLAFEGAEGLQVDGSLAPGGEASYFVVLAGAEPARGLEPTWVQLPPEPLAYTAGRLDESFQRTRAWEERSHKLKEALERAREELAGRDARLAELSTDRQTLLEETARLSAQLAAALRQAGDERERDERAAQLKRLEAELGSARSRLEDAEARLAHARADAERARRAQQEVAAQAHAVQELALQDRARRQEVSAQLEEARGRLAVAQEEQRLLQEKLSQARAELERLRAEAPRAPEPTGPSPQEREQARLRELALAEQRSAAHAEAEALRAELERLKGLLQAAGEERTRDQAERARLQRAAEADAAAAREARELLSSERAAFEEALAAREGDARGLDTELAWARAEVQRLSAEVRALSQQERAAGETLLRLSEQLGEAQEGRRRAEEERDALRAAPAPAGAGPSPAPQAAAAPPREEQAWTVTELASAGLPPTEGPDAGPAEAPPGAREGGA